MAGNSAVPWVPITLTDLQNAQAGPLVTAFQGTALGPGQTDPTVQIIQDVTAEILGAVGYSGRYTMDASQGSVSPDILPPNLKNFGVLRVTRVLRQRLEMDWQSAQQADERTYRSILASVRRGEYEVDATNNPSGSNISVKPGLVQINPGQRRQFTRRELWNI
jgi:hypothetical protein